MDAKHKILYFFFNLPAVLPPDTSSMYGDEDFFLLQSVLFSLNSPAEYRLQLDGWLN